MLLVVHCGLSICENVHRVYVACGMPSTPTECTQTVDVFIVHGFSQVCLLEPFAGEIGINCQMN